jgi:type VI secretion system protein ImpC
MAIISVNSGPVTFGKSQSRESGGGGSNDALRVLILGNFSGDTPRTLPLEARKHLRVDRDSFEEVFARLGVSVQAPQGGDPVRFQSLEELHPDHLYENLSLFGRYRSLKRQLRSPGQFADAVAALREAGLVASTEPKITSAPAELPQQNLWDSLLSSQVASSSAIDQLIRQTVAPYLEAKPHPQTEEYLAAVGQAENQLMRQFMHTGAFQKLEATWRSLDLLQRRVDLDRSCHLFILDASFAELQADLAQAQGDLQNTTLYRNFTRGNHRYDLLLWDHSVENSQESLALLSQVMDLAAQLDAVLLSAGAAELAGKKDFSLDEELPLSEEVASQWQNLRRHPAAANVFLAAPRYLVRLPFGKKTAVTDNFAFEELPEQGAHPFYLWGNGAYLMLLAMLESLERGESILGACRIENMPLHVYIDSDGDEAIKPCAEVYLPEPKILLLEQAGMVALQSVQNANSIFIGRWNSLKSLS